MHKSFKTFGLASAAMALAMAPAFAAAQDQATPGVDAPSMPDTGTTSVPPTSPSDTTGETYPDAVEGTPQGTVTSPPTMDDTTPDPTVTDPATPSEPAPRTITQAEQEAAIASWPTDTQAYYQSLSPERQQMFWALTDTDKVRLSELPEEQREVAWGQIEAQIKASQG